MAGEMSIASKILLIGIACYFAFHIIGIVVLSLLAIPLTQLGT